MQKNWNIEKITFKVVQIKLLAMLNDIEKLQVKVGWHTVLH